MKIPFSIPMHQHRVNGRLPEAGRPLAFKITSAPLQTRKIVINIVIRLATASSFEMIIGILHYQMRHSLSEGDPMNRRFTRRLVRGVFSI